MLYWRRNMGLKTLTSFMLAVFTPLAALAATQGSVAPKTIPEVRSHAYYILDESASSVLAARNEHIAVPIASITKLMTALVVLEAGQPMDQVVTINADDVVDRRQWFAPRGRFQAEPAGPAAPGADVVREPRRVALCRSYPRGLRAASRP